MINDKGKPILQFDLYLNLPEIYLVSWCLLLDAKSFKAGYWIGSNCEVKDNTAEK